MAIYQTILTPLALKAGRDCLDYIRREFNSQINRRGSQKTTAQTKIMGFLTSYTLDTANDTDLGIFTQKNNGKSNRVSDSLFFFVSHVSANSNNRGKTS